MLQPWIPLLSLIPDTPIPFLSLPCCLHRLTGPFTLSVFRAPEHDAAPADGWDAGLETGESRYKAYLMWLGYQGLLAGWAWEKEVMRVPSTRGWAIVGQWAHADGQGSADSRPTQVVSAGRRARRRMQSVGSGHWRRSNKFARQEVLPSAKRRARRIERGLSVHRCHAAAISCQLGGLQLVALLADWRCLHHLAVELLGDLFANLADLGLVQADEGDVYASN